MLKRFTLKKSGAVWALHDQLGDLIRTFKSKADALTGGTLEGIVGEGTVRIHREDGQLEEEHTLPALCRSAPLAGLDRGIALWTITPGT